MYLETGSVGIAIEVSMSDVIIDNAVKILRPKYVNCDEWIDFWERLGDVSDVYVNDEDEDVADNTSHYRAYQIKEGLVTIDLAVAKLNNE